MNEVGSHALLITKTILSDNGSIACVASNRSGEAAFQVCVYFIQFFVGNKKLIDQRKLAKYTALGTIQ